MERLAGIEPAASTLLQPHVGDYEGNRTLLVPLDRRMHTQSAS